jgi:hypothetical protein
VRNLKELENEAVTPMSSMPTKTTAFDVELTHGEVKCTYAAFKKVVVSKIVMHGCKVEIRRIWTAEGGHCAGAS